MPDISRYLQRISFLLRQGEPANDIALYLPTDDAWAGFTPGHVSLSQSMDALIGRNVIPQILDAGFGFDLIDDEAIAHGGLKHSILILPGVERIPLSTYKRIQAFAREGTVIAVRRAPSLAPGLEEAQTDTAGIRALTNSLFAAPGATGRLLPDDTKLGAALKAALPPDATRPPEVGFIHRKLNYAEAYFLVNTSNHPIHASASFRVRDLSPAFWDPATGRSSWAGDSNTVDLDLAPYESRVLIFSKERMEKPSPANGVTPPPIDLSAGWKATDGGPSGTVSMDKVAAWTEAAERKYFSGQVTYEKTVSIDPSLLASKRRLYLNFGEGTPVMADDKRAGPGMRAMLEGPVREAAVVYVNGKAAGSIWCPPYEVDIAALLHPGENDIRVVVASLALNLLAKGPLPDYKDLNAKYGERFQAQDLTNLQPLPAGLLGPVRLIAR